jgi:hypothetical protein
VAIGSGDVERVVGEISAGADDPNHVASVVGAFMQRQPAIGHYVQGHARELTLEGTVMVLLHAAVLARCIEIGRGRKPRALDFRGLDAATQAGAGPDVWKVEPALASYVDSNLAADDPVLGGARRAPARDLLAVIARALLAA